MLRPVSRKSEPVFLCLSSGAGAGGAGALHRLPVAGRPPPRAGQPLFHPLGLAGRPGGGDGCADAGRRHGAVPADPRASGPSGRRARNMAALSHQPRRALLRRAVPVPGAVLFDLKGWSVLW